MENRQETTRALVVDDEKDIRDGCERILTRMGCDVLKARNGEEALEVLEEREGVSIVLLDMKMPGMDGMEVLRRIKEKDPSILVIVITGFATLEVAIEAMKAGAYDFIPKPFEPAQLRIVAGRALEKQRLTIEAQRAEEERKRTLSDLHAEKSRTRTIIETLPNAVVVTNSQGQVVLMNPAFVQLLDLDPASTPGGHIGQYVKDEGFCALVMAISQGRYVDFEDIPPYELNLPNDRFLLARGQPVLGERKECLGAVMNLVDITSMRMLDLLKSEFVAKVSHELRSPLSTIHEQLVHVLTDMVGGASENDLHILSRAKEKTEGLITLIGDLLDLSRIEAGIVANEPRPLQVEEVLIGIVDFLATKAKGKDQTLTLMLPETPLPPVNADPLALESVFGNLITNAINYTPNGGTITVTADLVGISLRVRVADTGFGIEERHLGKIFERFFRVKNDKTRFITGTGLGLPIVKGLVESMGGFIEVTSEPGKGSTFSVLLPMDSPV